jgi:CheY-like chemotaxis protein
MALSEQLAPHLPYLRRYARAVTGSQASGDACVRSTLTALLSGQSELVSYLPPRVALYRLFHDIWARSATASQPGAAPEIRPSAVTASGRPALLLSALEGFSITEISQILQEAAEDVEQAIDEAEEAISKELTARVLIIEDETLIALDLENIVRELGHTVTGKAMSKSEALGIAHAERPSLILADINLGEGGSGLEAVVEILRGFSAPVVFVTAYPEHLLTGERPEPTYLVTKPFLPKTLQTTIGQALFFHSLRSPAQISRAAASAPPAQQAPAQLGAAAA